MRLSERQHEPWSRSSGGRRALTNHFQAELRAHFGEAWISGYEAMIPRMTNDEKDRHVLAAAVHGEASIIVTFNLRHFRTDHVSPWGIRALHPDAFLIDVFRRDESSVIAKLNQQASDRGRSLRELLDILKTTVPEFVAILSTAISPQRRPEGAESSR